MSGNIAKKLRIGIIDKLKDLDCFIDNDLPDYIMVMIANKKSSNQMKEDLSLFVGDNVGEFVDWLHNCLNEIKVGNDPFVKHDSTILANKKEDIVSKDSIIKPSQKTSLSSNPSNEEYKENSKKDKLASNVSIRKEITFTNEDKIRTQTEKKDKIESRSNRTHHKLIEFNSDTSNELKQVPIKRVRNQITFDTPTSSTKLNHQNPRNSNDRSPSQKQHMVSVLSRTGHNKSQQLNQRVTLSKSPQHSSRNNNTFIKTSFNQINNQQSPSNLSYQQSRFDDSHVKQNDQLHHHHVQSTVNLQSSVIRKVVKKEIRVEPTVKQSMLAKAIAEANRHSTLQEISLRKVDSESPKRSLVNRLGLPATFKPEQQDATIESTQIQVRRINDTDEDTRRERRLAKFSANNSARQQSVEIKMETGYERKPETIKIKPEIHTTTDINQNSKKVDLRVILSQKRKLDDPPNELSVAKRLNSKLQTNSSVIKEIENDEELKKLRNEIKPKIVLAESKKDHNKKEDDSDENVNVIIKRELLEKIKVMQATVDEQKNRLKLSGKEMVSTKKERCHYWPMCSNNECQYHHPKNICLQFPFCKFGANCLNVHPNCKFDSKCTNPICPYTHLTRKLISPKTKLLSSIHPIQKIQPMKK